MSRILCYSSLSTGTLLTMSWASRFHVKIIANLHKKVSLQSVAIYHYNLNNYLIYKQFKSRWKQIQIEVAKTGLRHINHKDCTILCYNFIYISNNVIAQNGDQFTKAIKQQMGNINEKAKIYDFYFSTGSKLFLKKT